VTRTSSLLLHTLREHLANEPQIPDPDMDSHRYATLARAYDEWDRTRAAWYLLLGVRLVNEALEDADA
jgi:hypothetical protein